MARTAWKCLALGAAALAAGCGDDFRYAGTPGQATSADFGALIAEVQVTVDGAGPIHFILDSGSPLTVLDTGTFIGAPGSYIVDARALGLDFPSLDAQLFDVLPFQVSGGDRLGGILGGDLLRHFALTLDYEGGRVFAWDGYSGAAPPVPMPGAGAPLDVPFRLEGGGLAEVVPGEVLLAPATRIVVDVSVEGRPVVPMMIDTGASFTLLDRSLVEGLGTPYGPRPTVQGLTVETTLGAAQASLVRIAHLQVGPPGAGAAADDLVAMELPDTTLLDGLSQEVGETVHGLVGGSFLSRFLATVDYPRSRLVLQPYADGGVALGDLPGFGFDLELASDGAAEVLDVETPSAAADAGVQAGDRLVAIEGEPVAGMPFARVIDDVASFGLWETVPFTFARGAQGAAYTASLQVRPLLGDYPPQITARPPGANAIRVLGRARMP